MGELKVYSLKDVKEHCGQTAGDPDVWIVIHDRVYDVTKFLDDHPGGEEVLFDVAGKDATENFEDVGHSTDAREMMKEYLIGELRKEDRTGSDNPGKKDWPNEKEEGSNWLMWTAPVALAFVATVIYFVFLNRS